MLYYTNHPRDIQITYGKRTWTNWHCNRPAIKVRARFRALDCENPTHWETDYTNFRICDCPDCTHVELYHSNWGY
jgi:hypothetical protein